MPNSPFTFDLIGLQVKMLQCGADSWNSLQFVEAQVQLHQPAYIKGVGWDPFVLQQIVGHPYILQLS